MAGVEQEDEVCRGAMQTFIRRATDLYTLPAVAMQVLDLTESPKVDARALKECIENDPALTGKLLRVVNSSLFGLRGEVTDLNQAIALLGIKPLRMLVLSFNLPRELFQSVDAEVLGRYWTHSLVKAVTCREMARRFWGTEGDDAFVAGLLQELGVLVLIQRVGTSYCHFLAQVQSSAGGRLCELEQNTLGFDHLAITSGLLSHWSFPTQMVEAISEPQSVDHLLEVSGPHKEIAQILHLSEMLAEVLIEQKSHVVGELVRAADAYRDITPQDLEPLLADLEETIPDLAAVLNLEVEGDDYRNILADAHVRLSEYTEEFIVTEALKSAQDNLAREFRAQQSRPQPVIATSKLKAKANRSADKKANTTSAATARQEAQQDAQQEAQQVNGKSSGRTATEKRDPAFTSRVANMISRCRQRRECLTLVVAQIDNYQDWVLRGTILEANQLAAILIAGARAIIPEDGDAFKSGDGQVAMLFPDATASEGIEAARKLITFLARGSEIKLGREATASIGVATMDVPSRNFPPSGLIDSACRCIAAAHQSGGGQVKSIQVL